MKFENKAMSLQIGARNFLRVTFEIVSTILTEVYGNTAKKGPSNSKRSDCLSLTLKT